MLRFDTISPTMHSLAIELKKFLGPSWYLAGGTALALRIGHRKSVDLDYFTRDEFLVEELKEQLMVLWESRGYKMVYEAPGTLWCEVDGVKVSFIRRSVDLLESAEQIDDICLAGLSDIVIMKLLAICSREEYKDYFDLASLSKLTDTEEWLGWWEKIYPTQDPSSWLIALGVVDLVPPIPLLVMSEYESLEVANTIKDLAFKIQGQIRKQS
jgi:hypothetical protein